MLFARFEIGQKHKQSDEASSRASWNTPRSDSRRGLSYASRMALSFALTSLMTVLVLTVVVTVVWGGVFSDYTRANISEIAQLTAQRLADSYEEDGEWSTEFLASIAESNLVSSDIGLQVMDEDGTILYDDSWPAAPAAADASRGREDEDAASEDEGAGTPSAGTGSSEVSSGSSDAAAKASHSPVSTAPTDADSAVTEPIKLSDGETVGQVRLWVLGSDALLTKADTAFREIFRRRSWSSWFTYVCYEYRPG